MFSSLQNTILNGSLPLVLVTVAAAGAIASLSSCTLARLPVIWGYIAAGPETGRKGFSLSLAFACGLIVSYTALGFVFGGFSDWALHLVHFSRLLYSFLGLLLVISGLIIAELLFPNKKHHHAHSPQKPIKRISSAFLFGILFACLEMPSCPCCGAVLMVIASLVVLKGSFMYSGIVFTSFAVGQSLPILLIGFSTSLLKNLTQRAEKIEKVIRFSAGIILTTTGLFLIGIA